MAARRPTEHRDQRRLGEPSDLADGLDPPVAELAGGYRPDAPEPFDRQRVEKGQLAVGRHRQQTVGLGHAARDLGEELGPGHPDGDGQTNPLADVASQRSASARRRRGTPRRSTAPRPVASCVRTPRTPPCSPRSTPASGARPRSPAGTAGGPARRPSRCGHRTPWPRNSPPGRPPSRRSRGGRADEGRLVARPTHRTRRGRRAGSCPPSTRTHVRTPNGEPAAHRPNTTAVERVRRSHEPERA